MAKGLLLPTRRAILTHFKAKTGVTDLIGQRFYGQTAPAPVTWPFAKLGAVSGIPIKSACVDGMTYRATVHVFAKPVYNASQAMTETAEDHCARIAAAVEVAGDGARLAITGATGGMFLIQTIIMQDGAESDAYHAVIDFSVRVLA
jgi:hypothetical protein